MKILLAGDSWGVGEWSKLGYLTHNGLEEYFKKHNYDITNVSVPSIGNSGIVYNITHALQREKFDIVFFIQTDPLRDVSVDFKSKWFKDYKHLQKIINSELEKIYFKLNMLNLPIYCMGGCTKLNLDILKKYKNLKPAIPSIIKFLGYEQPNIWISSNWHKFIDKKWDLKTIDQILNEFAKMGRLENQLYFKEDGGHPDREGLEKVFYFLKEKVLDQNFEEYQEKQDYL